MLSQHPLPLSALAAILGCTRSTIRHFADRLGFRYTIRRTGPRGQRIACLTPDQAQLIATEVERETAAFEPTSSSSTMPRHSEATAGSSSSSSTPGTRETDASTPPKSPPIHQSNNPRSLGHFYLLQLEPEHDPGRFKLGFSSDLESRLDQFLTVVPLARLIACWPAHRSWERIAIISTAQNAEQLSEEVFRIERLEDAVAAANRFFAVMPKLTTPTHLQMSPLAQTPQIPKERRCPNADPRSLPEAAISRPRGGPIAAAKASSHSKPPHAEASPPSESSQLTNTTPCASPPQSKLLEAAPSDHSLAATSAAPPG